MCLYDTAPMCFKGSYHLFYQYNPKGSVWGNIVWAHSISMDLVNWEALEPAIFPSEPFDIKGTWSGSATVYPDGNPVIYYTGVDAKGQQVQNYAIPADITDKNLRKWVKPKEGNPMVVADKEINGSAFRDPTTAWQANGYWNILVGSRKGSTGVAYLFKSKDKKTWTKTARPLHEVPNTGRWECPDIFPVSTSHEKGLDFSELGKDVKHVLNVSLDVTRFEYYTIGTYFPDQDKYVPDKGQVDGWDGLKLDYGNFYASKSFYDPVKLRRVVWGWANESDSKEEDVKKGWAGILPIPRTVRLDTSGKQLLVWPIDDIETLKGNKVQMSNQQLETGKPVKISGITGNQADVEVTFSIPNLQKAEPFDLSWKDPRDLCYKKKSRNRHSTVMTNVYKPMFGGFVDVDLSDRKLSLRSLIDKSVVESFAAGGKTCSTSRVYPTLAVFQDAQVFAFNNGTEPVTLEHASA
ncbi:Glycoside hydrolase, family 32 [Gossypium australe]|uniref:Glycoside hydrolase, family 32 n=1 Tax=Gossypium australe TaxID=47621 RepID=A0A5B6UB33_9ROSI|nr:Glycoside hydrolase, family 32 [Gossypium australe]